MNGHLISTVAVLSSCHRCDMPTLRALDEGVPARVDLLPLPGFTAEIVALAAGRATYTHLRGHLIYRDQSRLADPDLAYPVHAEHACLERTAR